jgi:hypothetical protein
MSELNAPKDTSEAPIPELLGEDELDSSAIVLSDSDLPAAGPLPVWGMVKKSYWHEDCSILILPLHWSIHDSDLES